MKKQAILLIAAVCLTLCCGCSNASADKKDHFASSSAPELYSDLTSEGEASESSENSIGISYLTDNKETPVTSSSSVNSPLGLGEWGVASKYCIKTKSYVNVPVRLISVRRGAEAADEIKKLGAYLFESKESEYAIAEYEICLNDFPTGEAGTWCDITGSVTGIDGEMMKLDDGSYMGASIDFFTEDKNLYYEGIVRSKVYYSIVKDRTDYLLKIGEAGETAAYFKPE